MLQWLICCLLPLRDWATQYNDWLASYCFLLPRDNNNVDFKHFEGDDSFDVETGSGAKIEDSQTQTKKARVAASTTAGNYYKKKEPVTSAKSTNKQASKQA